MERAACHESERWGSTAASPATTLAPQPMLECWSPPAAGGKPPTDSGNWSLAWCGCYLVIELPDVLLDVREQASEGELLNELPDVFMVIQGQAGSMAPLAPKPSFHTFGLIRGSSDSVQAAQTTQRVQFEGTALHVVAGAI